ncbi:MAG: tRNA (N6-isopentenyl adenosine(37)-C2)-methylthiotransferase MiaB [Phycisphaerales bacterium]|nr:tRNA (N6-isopentenyl adenosine(37)-C2)-methylthiotransferase MiaB [Phycisphaerales bacterium]MCB9863240.1 tRNA (N6-isopentenyl adenosine(37)-C2)-methylthiotransferase MiaB [Phycisphaerales bacterium]
MTPKRSVYLETMGCQMNALDSELALGSLMQRGYQLTGDLLSADLVVINTCSVRQHAEDKVYSRLGQIKGGKTMRREGQIVAVIGCMAERDGDGLLDKMPHVDILCGPSELHRLPGLVNDVEATRERAIALSGRLRDHTTNTVARVEHDDLEALDSSRHFGVSQHAAMPKIFGRHQAYVRITRGCNKFCTFCVVPYTRGPEQHRPPGQIVEEVRQLADNGVVEVTLLGQTVNHYHFDPKGPENTSFAQLIRRVHDEVPQLPRLRFVTSYPRDFTDEALRVMAESPRICKYLHIPAQSGSDSQLKRMNRGYTADEYMRLIDRARALMPDLAIAGDMIVGFSGETEEDFQKSLDLLRYCRYKNCFVFKYSPRPGTNADGRLPDDVPEEEKRRRNNEMLAVQAEVSLSNHRSMLGTKHEVLVEGRSKAELKRQESEQERGGEIDRNAETLGGKHPVARRIQLVGRTQGDQIVVFDGESDWIGRFANIEIIAATPYTLHGQVADAADVSEPSSAGGRAISLSVLRG